MKKLKALLQKYETRHMALLMEIEYLEKHNYQLEILWAQKEKELVVGIIAELRACTNGSEKEDKI